MFGNKAKKDTDITAALNNSVIGNSTIIKGDIENHGELIVNGKVFGNIYGKGKVTIGSEGDVEGDLHALNADIYGVLNGFIKIEEQLNIKGKAAVTGDIQVGKLNIEPTATFSGQIKMATHQVPKALLNNENPINGQ